MAALPRTSAPRSPRGDMPLSDRTAAREVADLFAAGASRGGSFQILGADGRHVPVPGALADVVRQAAQMLADGRPVTVLPDETMLSSQEAADLLNVSRQYLVRLADAGTLAAVKIGRHRRLRAADVATYKAGRDARRTAELDRLVDLSEDVDGYGLSPRGA